MHVSGCLSEPQRPGRGATSFAADCTRRQEQAELLRALLSRFFHLEKIEVLESLVITLR
jgi:hypothetical protein